jgi:outer membrane protein assembly factor BamD
MLLTAAVLAGAVACGGTRAPRAPAPGERDADKFLFDRGSEALKERHWIEAREYFRRLVDTYPSSQYRADAKLGVGDTYLGENRADSFILAANEFREFLRFFPLDRRADYAQYKLAIAHSKQMLGPERDQTATLDTLREIETFLKSYPNSELVPEVQKLRRQTRDRLSDAEYRVGVFYFRNRVYSGAMARLTSVIDNDPEYTRRDAAYYYLAETLYRVNLRPQAAAMFERLLKEFQSSEYLERAQKRLAEIKR